MPLQEGRVKEGVSQGVFMEKLSYVVLESGLHIFPLPEAGESV